MTRFPKPSALVPALLLPLALSLSACDAQNPDADPTEMVSDTDPVMNAAIAEAQETLPEWLAILENPPEGYDGIAFKYPLEGVEHIWVANVRRDGDMLVGQLSNNPMNGDYALGQEVTVPLSEVSDWAYWDETGKAHGYRTSVALFDQMDPAEVAAIKRDFGWTE